MSVFKHPGSSWNHPALRPLYRWYCRYDINRDLEEMMAESGVAIDHVTLYRWVQRYAPELKAGPQDLRQGG